MADAWINIYQGFKKEKFNAVFTFTPKPGLLGQIAAKMAGTPIICNTIFGFYEGNILGTSGAFLARNYSYGGDYGISPGSTTTIVNDSYGVTHDNLAGDMRADSTGRRVVAYNTTFDSASELRGGPLSTSSSFLVSRSHDGAATTTKIWGGYNIPLNNTETPQDESYEKFNYASSSWVDSMTEPLYLGDGTEDTDLSLSFNGAMAGTSSVYAYRVMCSAANCSTASSTWAVYRYDATGTQELICTIDSNCADSGTQFTDSGTNVRFTIQAGATSSSYGDTYTFTAWKGSTDTNQQKDVQVMQNSDQILVGSGTTLEIKGDTTSCATANRRTLVRRDTATSSSGYRIVATGTVDFQCSDFDYLGGTGQKGGIELNGSSTVASLNNIALDNFFATSTANSSYVLVDEDLIGSSQPSKTIDGIALESSGDDPSWNFNTKEDDGGLTGYWLFTNATGTFSGESFDGDNDAADADPGRFNWQSGVTISGIFYQSNESTPDPGQCNGSTQNLTLLVNGASSSTTDCDTGTGAFSFTNISATAGDTITIFSTGADKANTVFVSEEFAGFI